MSRNYRGKKGRRSAQAAIAAVFGILVVLAVILVASRYIARPGGGDSSASSAQGEGSSSQTDTGSQNPDGSTASSDGSGQTAEPPAQKGVGYDFTQPAPASEAVDNSYFDDAAFVGDSRTDGFLIYSGIGTGKNLTSNGLSIFELEEKKALTIDGKEYTLMEALALEQYGKVYLSLGVNELGYFDDQGFYDSYCKAIDDIKAIQPNAVIYIQGLIPLNEEKIAATSGRTYLTNDHLRVYNDLMRQAAEEKQVVYLDLYSEFVDENGSLPADASEDGVHLSKEYCQRWLEYLKTHTVSYDTLYPQGGE